MVYYCEIWYGYICMVLVFKDLLKNIPIKQIMLRPILEMQTRWLYLHYHSLMFINIPICHFVLHSYCHVCSYNNTCQTSLFTPYCLIRITGCSSFQWQMFYVLHCISIHTFLNNMLWNYHVFFNKLASNVCMRNEKVTEYNKFHPLCINLKVVMTMTMIIFYLTIMYKFKLQSSIV